MTVPIRILTLAQWADGAPWRWELQHSFDTHALIWITRGQGRCTITGSRRGLGTHNALALPAKTLFSFDYGPHVFGHVALIEAGGPILMPDEPQHLRVRDAHSQADLTGLMDSMLREQTADRDFADEAVVAQGHLLTVWLRRAMIEQDTSIAETGASAPLLRAFSALVERDYLSGKPLAEYARSLGVTPTHLTRACRQSCGLTAADMITERVLHAARTALEDGDEPINIIAADLGFSSATYFSRFIQHHTGSTPSALRKKPDLTPEPHA